MKKFIDRPWLFTLHKCLIICMIMKRSWIVLVINSNDDLIKSRFYLHSLPDLMSSFLSLSYLIKPWLNQCSVLESLEHWPFCAQDVGPCVDDAGAGFCDLSQNNSGHADHPPGLRRQEAAQLLWQLLQRLVGGIQPNLCRVRDEGWHWRQGRHISVLIHIWKILFICF